MAPRALNICFAIIRWAPVVFITAVVVWSYYAYVIQMCLFTVDSIPEKVVYLLFYHPILCIFMWAYARTIFTEPGKVPKEFYLSRSDGERFESEENEEVQREILARAARNLPVQNRTGSGCVRYCEKCKCIKPDRAHHCSVCGQCVLKMDHHCPWVNNCVCFTNYKFFVLFLGYAFIYCIYVSATSLQYFIKFWTRADLPSSSLDQGLANTDLNNLHILFLFFAAIMFSISVLALLGYHLWLVSKNRSTLESFRAPIFRSGPDKDGFSLGRQGNFIEIFGDDKKLWFLPVFSSVGDGVTYPTRVAQPAPTYSSMDNTTPSAVVTLPSDPNPESTGLDYSHIGFGDGVTYPIRTVDEDYDSLLGQRQRWAEEGEVDGGPGYDNTGMQSERM